MHTTKPLQGITVVSIEQALAAPLCTARLAEAGARVIKIERQSGDFARGYDQAIAGESSYFVWTNQGKESVILDFKQEKDAALLERLIADADIFVQNLVPGALAKIGLDSQTLQQRYPRLIICDISGYNPDTQTSHLKAYDLLVQAESGLLDISGGVNEIGRIGVSICDIGAGMSAHAGILEALLLRANTNQGSHLQIALFDVVSDWMSVPLAHYEYAGKSPKRVGLNHPSIAPYGAYPTKDNEAVIIGIQNEIEWQRFCEVVLNNADLAHSPAYHSNTQRVNNRSQMDKEICAVSQTLTKEQFIERLMQAKIAYGSVNSVENLSKHKGLRRRKMQLSTGQSVTMPARAINNLSFTIDRTRVPTLGEHTEKIRQEFSS